MDSHVPTSDRSGTILASLALVSSFGTLICCALPAALVAVGAGAVVAGLVTAVPQLVTLSEHKAIVFAVASLLLGAGAFARYATRNAPCPADPRAAASCRRLRRIGGVVLWTAAGILVVGFFAAYMAPLLMS